MLPGACLNPIFPLESHETCKNIVRNDRVELENDTAKRAREWGSVTHPQNEVAFSAFSGFDLSGGPVASEKKTVSGNAFYLGQICFSRLPASALYTCLGLVC